MIGNYLSKLILGINNYYIRNVKTGLSLIFFDSIVEVSESADSELPSFPVESKGFQNDSKIKQPRRISVTVVKSGRFLMGTIIKTLEEEVDGYSLFNIGTVFYKYQNYALKSFSWTRDPSTAFRILITLDFEQIRLVEPKYINFALDTVESPDFSQSVALGKTSPIPIDSGSATGQILSGGS